jgi:4-amino-4-deoxy-L-arabinose transferase-like glycosyltransferase
MEMGQASVAVADRRTTEGLASPLGEKPAVGGRTALVWILLLGTAVRVALWAGFQHVPPHTWDEQEYNTLAKNLLAYGEFGFKPGDPLSLRPPLYPAFLAGVYALFGVENFQAVRLLQVALSLLTVLLVYDLGCTAFSRRVGLWAAGLCCFYPSLIGYTDLILTETLFTCLLCGACALLARALRRPTLAVLAGAGVVLGLAALARSVVWLFVPVLAVFLLVALRGGWRTRLAGAAVLVLAFAVTIAPWSVRNTRLQKTFVAIDVMGGRNFLMGNYTYTPLYRSWDTIGLTGEDWWAQVCQLPSYVEPETQGQVDKLALRLGLQFVKDNPGLTLRRDVVKFFDFWGLERELVAGAAGGSFGPVPRPVVLLLALVIVGAYVATLFAGIFGAALVPPADWRPHAFALLLIAFVCGIHTLVFAHSRYHLPVMPLVLLYAASALVSARAVWQQRGSWRFRLACGLVCVLVAGWAWLFVAVDLERYRNALQAAL